MMRTGAAVRMLALRASVSNVGNAKQRYDDSSDFFHRVSQLSFVGVLDAGGHGVTPEISAGPHYDLNCNCGVPTM